MYVDLDSTHKKHKERYLLSHTHPIKNAWEEQITPENLSLMCLTKEKRVPQGKEPRRAQRNLPQFVIIF